MAAFSAGLVALLCAVIAAASWRALLRTANRRIALVVAAFAILALKNLVKCILLVQRGENPAFELVFSLTDLTAVGLIAAPILSRRP